MLDPCRDRLLPGRPRAYGDGPLLGRQPTIPGGDGAHSAAGLEIACFEAQHFHSG